MSVLTYYLADQNPHRDRSLGISGYSLGLLKELSRYDALRINSLISRSSIKFDQVVIDCCLPIKTDHVVGRLLADHLHSPFLPVADIYHYPKGFLPTLIPAKKPVVATVHDTIIQYYADHYPGSRSRFNLAYWQYQLRHTLRTADLVIAVSEFTKWEIISFCERFKIKVPPITVTYEGAEGEELVGTVGSKKNYAVAFASRLPHKQTERLLELWSVLEQKQGWDTELLLIGSILPEIETLKCKCRYIRHVPFLPSDELKQKLSMARALLMPSEIEGFGLPALEAVYSGTPVVYVKGTSVEEILGSAGHADFNLNDTDSFVNAVETAFKISSEQLATDAVQLSKQFAWRSVAERTLQAYSQLIPSIYRAAEI